MGKYYASTYTIEPKVIDVVIHTHTAPSTNTPFLVVVLADFGVSFLASALSLGFDFLAYDIHGVTVVN